MLLTHIQVFAGHDLSPGEADITLPRPCPELSPLQAGSAYQISYHLGSYPVFELAPA
jgi:hypothetical protein